MFKNKKSGKCLNFPKEGEISLDDCKNIKSQHFAINNVNIVDKDYEKNIPMSEPEYWANYCESSKNAWEENLSLDAYKRCLDMGRSLIK